MKQGLFQIQENTPLTREVSRMVLAGDTAAILRPGQFINIALDGFFLRRPISVCDWNRKSVTILFKVVGQGTRRMRILQPGDTLDVLTGLGNGYDLTKSGGTPLLVGGGVGIPPLYGLAKRLIVQEKKPQVILGFNTKDEVFYAEEFAALGCTVAVTTVDGSLGAKGFVTQAMVGKTPTCVYACGPEAMLKAVYDATDCPGQFSFEARMGCGFGACMGCSCETKYGYKRICKEGPVLERGEILW